MIFIVNIIQKVLLKLLSSSRFFYHYPVDLTSVLRQRVAYENDNFRNLKPFEKQIKI